MRIGFLGDLYIREGSSDAILRLLEYTLVQLLSEVDILIINLEAPIIRGGQKISKWGPHIKNCSNVIDVLEKFNDKIIVSLANNHINDFGGQGIRETVSRLNLAKIRWFGLLSDDYDKTYIDIHDIRIIGYADDEFNLYRDYGIGVIEPFDPILSRNLQTENTVILFGHVGLEYSFLPTPHQVQLYEFYKHMGVAHHVMSHSHVVQIPKHSDFVSSLGNFIFENDTATEDERIFLYSILNTNTKIVMNKTFQINSEFTNVHEVSLNMVSEQQKERKHPKLIDEGDIVTRFLFPLQFRGSSKIIPKVIQRFLATRFANKNFRENMISSATYYHMIKKILKDVSK